MSMITDEIKKISEQIKDAEDLKKLCSKGFIKCIDNNYNPKFEIKAQFYKGSGIENSINQKMYQAQQRGLKLLENELKAEAKKIIKQILGTCDD